MKIIGMHGRVLLEIMVGIWIDLEEKFIILFLSQSTEAS
jgi:hypothetical protein